MCSKYVYTFGELRRANDTVVDVMCSLSLRPKAPGLVCILAHHAASSTKQIEIKYNWELFVKCFHLRLF
jgi:hypothetical protein